MRPEFTTIITKMNVLFKKRLLSRNNISGTILIATIMMIIAAVEAAKSGDGKAANTRRRYLLNKPQCNENEMKKIEMMIAKLVGIGPHGRPFPENLQQLKPYCRETDKLLQKVSDFFKDCYKKEVRDQTAIMIYSMKSNIRKYCGSSRQKGTSSSSSHSKRLRAMLRIAPCANRHVRLQLPCVGRFVNDTKQLIGVRQDRDKITFACCNYVQMMRCLDHFLDDVGCIDASNRETILEFVRGLAKAMIDVMCGEYNESTDQCDRLRPAPKPVTPVKRHYETFAFVLIDLLESMKALSND